MSCHVASVIQRCLGKDVVVGMWSLMASLAATVHAAAVGVVAVGVAVSNLWWGWWRPCVA